MVMSMTALTIERIESEVEDQTSDVALYKIIPYPADFTLQVLHEKWKSKEISVPPFQRRFVWKLPRSSRLIESFLLGLPVPGIFLYREEQNQELLVVDGQQRLRTVFGYFEGTFPGTNSAFFLTGVRSNWDGRLFDQLSSADQIRLRDSVLRATIMTQLDPKDDTSLYQIFERLNTGGVALTPQEIRNCINQGPFNDLLVNLNTLTTWRQVLGAEGPDDRMRDIELVLRSLALAFGAQEYAKPMKDFLGRFMKASNKASEERLHEFDVAFIDACDRLVTGLGSRPFHLRRGVNAAACDAVMVAFIRNVGLPPDLSERYLSLKTNPAFLSAISAGTTDVDTVRERLELASAILFS